MNISRDHLIELVRYGLVSACAFVVDAGLLALLHFTFGLHYLLAASVSFVIGGAVAYFLSIRFVFRHRRLDGRSVEGPAFIALGLAGLGVNTLIMLLVVGKGGASVLLGKLFAACGTFGVNYLLRKILLFTRARTHDLPPAAEERT